MRVFSCVLVVLCLAAGIAHAGIFRPVALDQCANWNDYFVSLPTGDVSFDQIPFYLSQSNPAFITTGNWPYTPDWTGSISVPASAASPVAVHLLINGGNMYLDQMGVQVGLLRFTGKSGSVFDVPLVGGANIRECSPYSPDQVINTLTDPNVREVWSGRWNGWMNVPARIDLYSVYLPSNLGSLQSIEIRDLVPHPAIAVYGITVETVPEPTSILTLICGIAGLGGDDVEAKISVEALFSSRERKAFGAEDSS